MLPNDCADIYWQDIPIGKENAIAYSDLCFIWNVSERKVRDILHDLSLYDNGDDYILIRSGKAKGFYKTDDKAEIEAYRRECLSKGRSVFAPVKKCNRVLRKSGEQYDLFNNLRSIRESKDLKQRTVCKYMKQYDRAFDTALLSKMENGVCLPTPKQLNALAVFYGVNSIDLIDEGIYTQNQ